MTDEKLINEVESIIEQIDNLKCSLQEIAKKVNPNKPWKRVIREDLGIVI